MISNLITTPFVININIEDLIIGPEYTLLYKHLKQILFHKNVHIVY